jgi:hypothetical protein
MSVAADAGPASAPSRVAVGPRNGALRHARTCYDHLAGEIAVAITDSLSAAGYIELSGEGGLLTGPGADFLQRRLGIDLSAAGQARSSGSSRRVFCRPCLDWSERRFHLAGAVGSALCACYFERGWMRRAEGTRAVGITPPGRLALGEFFGLPSSIFRS